jgi:hypothetical protein
MIRVGHETVSFFIGTEVEHTPAFGLRTLFVVGLQDPQIVIQEFHNNDCEHVYFGANQSFPQYDIDKNEMQEWQHMIGYCLDHLPVLTHCTLDIDVGQVERLVKSRLTEYRNFIPMISVKLPYIRQLGYNATLKIDDRDFAATNPGVWCHSLHHLQNRDLFTDWSKYTKDNVIK